MIQEGTELVVADNTGAKLAMCFRIIGQRKRYAHIGDVIKVAVKEALPTGAVKKGQVCLAVVVRNAHDAVMVQDLEGRILAWNPGAERMYGWSEAEALAMNIRDLITESRRAEESPIVQQLCRAEVLEPYRTQRVAKDGRIVEVWLTATALVNEAGEVYAIATTERGRG